MGGMEAYMKRTCTITRGLLGGGLTLLLVFVLVGPAGAQSCVTPPVGMVSWWDADSVSGITASDIQDGNDGTLIGGVTIVPGKVGNAFSLAGIPASDDHVSISNAANLEPQTLTVDVWVKATGLGDFNDLRGAVIVSKDHTTGVSYALFGPGNTNRITATVDMTDGTRAEVVSPNPFSFNEWHHVAMTWDGSTLKLYVNGILQGTDAVGAKTILYQDIDVNIGRHPFFEARYFAGLIDEVELFDRALTETEIQDIFGADIDGKCKLQTVSIGLCLPGVTRVVVFTADGFDAADINEATVEFGGVAPLSCKLRDVDSDGDDDLVCDFLTKDVGPSPTLTAETIGGDPITGGADTTILHMSCGRR